MRTLLVVLSLGLAACSSMSSTPPATILLLFPEARLVPARYTSALDSWLAIGNVCVDASAPALVQSRVAVLAARAGLPVVAADAGCSWRLSVVDAAPTLSDAKAAAVWRNATDQVERHVVVTTFDSASASTILYGADPRGQRYAVGAAFAILGRDASGGSGGGAVYVPAATVVDWPAMAVRGIVEGFYGPAFTVEARASLLSTMDELRQNRYVYSPQTEDYAHALWASPYPTPQLADFAAAAAQAADAGIDFTWAVRPGQGLFYGPVVPISYSGDADFATLTAKYQQLASVGLTHFGLFFDDNTEALTNPADMARFATFMDAQAYLINRVDDWLRGQNATARLLVVGTRYTKAVDGWQDYNQFMAAHVHATVDFLWTGNETYSPTIDAADLSPVDTSLGRQPIVWDNWPQEVVAVDGRSADLPTATEGLLSNPVICSWLHLPASAFIQILGTAAMYEWRPDLYNHSTALARWQAYEATLPLPLASPSPSPSPS